MDERIRSTAPVATVAARAARKTIQRIARRAVPKLADFAVVFVVERRQIVGIAAAHVSPDGDKLLRSLLRIYRIRRDDLLSTVAQVVRTGEPSMRRSILVENLPDVPRGGIADLHRRLACQSALVLPIRVGQTVTGAVSLCYAGSGRTYAPADLAGARRIAHDIERMTPSPLPHAAPRLHPATGDARRRTAVRRRVAARN